MVFSLNCEISVYNKYYEEVDPITKVVNGKKVVTTSITKGEYELIPSTIINKVVGFSIENKIDNLTDLCEIILPKPDAIIELNSNKVIEFGYNYDTNNYRLFVGSRVEIKYGYNITNFTNEPIKFIGYIESIKENDTNIILKCEDSMYLFKYSKRVNYSEKNYTLKSFIVNAIRDSGISTTKLPDNQIEIIDFTFQKIKGINLMNVSEIIQMIKESYSFYAYFRIENNKPIFYMGLKYPVSNNYTSNNFEFQFPYNKLKNIVLTPKLNNVTNDYNNTYVVVTSKQGDNTVISVFSDSENPNGVVINTSENATNPKYDIAKEKDNKIELNIPGLSIIECTNRAVERLKQVNFNSLSGTFDTFGEPYFRTGDIIKLTKNSNVSSSIVYEFYIDTIQTKYANGSGIKRTVTLGDFVKIS